jgi:hypothetical protein
MPGRPQSRLTHLTRPDCRSGGVAIIQMWTGPAVADDSLALSQGIGLALVCMLASVFAVMREGTGDRTP